MDFDKLLQNGLDFTSGYSYAAFVALAVMGLLLYFKFKLFIKLAFVCAILGAVAYILVFIFDLTSTGIENKEKFLSNPTGIIDKLR